MSCALALSVGGAVLDVGCLLRSAASVSTVANGACVRRLVPAGPGPDPIALADPERLVNDVPG